MINFGIAYFARTACVTLCCEVIPVSPGQLVRMTKAFDHELPGMSSRPLPPAVKVRAHPHPILAGAMPATMDFLFDLPRSSAGAHIAVYDARGRLVRNIYDGKIDKLDLLAGSAGMPMTTRGGS